MVERTAVVIDDRLLIEELLVGLGTSEVALQTTAYWYCRACRASVAGAGGHLSGPFARLDPERQSAAVHSLLALRNDIELPDPRLTVPAMVDVSQRHPRLNLLNLEAVAAAVVSDATVWLSAAASAGVLPNVLDEEGVSWRTVEIE